MSNPIAQLENVRLIYHEPHAETLAIDDISAEFERGKFTALVGPSGCGKTSILSILAGIMPPSGGTVTVEEKGFTTRKIQRERHAEPMGKE